jgi:peptide/nickel transport system permease protein
MDATSPLDLVHRMLLPWITLAFLYAASYARLTRAGMLETMNEDYVRTARAKGLRERNVVIKHGLRGALTPILTIFGLDFGLLIGGAVLTERVFSLNGLGKYAIDGITTNDLPKVLGVTLMAALFVIVANLIVDLLYAVVDPRVRTKRPSPTSNVPPRRRARAPSSRSATCACTSRPTTAW